MNPEIQAILDAFPDDAGDFAIEQARAAHGTETAVLAGEGVPVGAVRDDEIAGVPVRIYEPGDARGTVAYFHGGGWVMGNRDSVDAVCRALANDARVRVISVDYRLAPEHPFPAGLEDALAVVDALGDVAVAGDSAGGNLAAVVARKRRAVRFQLLVYPVTDAGLNTPSYSEFGEFGLDAAAMSRFWKLYGAAGFDPDASPLRADDLAGVAPAYVITASHDVLRDEGEAYAAALERAGVAVTKRRVEGTVHGFWRWQTTAIARDTVREAAVALRAALG